MRIAVLIYGRLNKCVEHYNNEIDFFLSSDNSSESLLNDFIRIYKPILYNNNPLHYDYNLGNFPGVLKSTNIHNMTCHFINKNRVFSLLEEYVNRENVNYDGVVSLRIDSVFENHFVFNNLLDNTVYIPRGADSIDKGINDQVAYGKVDAMKKYHSIDAYYLLERKLSIPHPESLFYAHIKCINLQVIRVDLNR